MNTLFKNTEGGSASICFLISLNEYGESADAFKLKLLKGGTIIADGFEAPQTIWKAEESSRGYENVELTVYHDVQSYLDTTSHYQLSATYEKIDENVSMPF